MKILNNEDTVDFILFVIVVLANNVIAVVINLSDLKQLVFMQNMTVC